MSSTSHITIVGLNIVDPVRTRAMLTSAGPIAFLSGYLNYQCSIPHGEECRRLKVEDKRDAGTS
jgi:hypothetical protein